MSTDDIDDAFWALEFSDNKDDSHRSGRAFLVPDWEHDDERDNDTSFDPYAVTVYLKQPVQSLKSEDNECVQVRETRWEQGVFGAIGGEVWEAALLLCAHMVSDGASISSLYIHWMHLYALL